MGNYQTIYSKVFWSILFVIIFMGMVGNTFARSDSTTIIATADDQFQLYLNGKLVMEGREWLSPPKPIMVKLSPGDVLSAKGKDFGIKAGFLLSAKGKHNFVSDTTWKVFSGKELTGWNTKSFNDASWENATSYGAYGVDPWIKKVKGFSNQKANWIWSKKNQTGTSNIDSVVFFRKKIK